MNFDFTFILIIVFATILYLIKDNFLVRNFKLIKGDIVLSKSSGFYFLNLYGLIHLLSIGLFLISLSSIDYEFRYSDFILMAVLLSSAELFNVTNKALVASEFHFLELEINLVKCLSLMVMFISFIFLNNVMNIKDFVTYQNATHLNIPSWNIFITFPLAYTYISNYLLSHEVEFYRARIIGAFELSKQLLKTISFVISFIILFLGGFYSFGNLDVLIGNSYVVSVVLYLLAALKVILLIIFLTYAERINNRKGIFELRLVTYRNLKINLVYLVIVLFYRALI